MLFFICLFPFLLNSFYHCSRFLYFIYSTLLHFFIFLSYRLSYLCCIFLSSPLLFPFLSSFLSSISLFYSLLLSSPSPLHSTSFLSSFFFSFLYFHFLSLVLFASSISTSVLVAKWSVLFAHPLGTKYLEMVRSWTSLSRI